jgi:hypothetical protein
MNMLIEGIPVLKGTGLSPNLTNGEEFGPHF